MGQPVGMPGSSILYALFLEKRAPRGLASGWNEMETPVLGGPGQPSWVIPIGGSTPSSPHTEGLRVRGQKRKQKRKNLKEQLRHFWSKVKPQLVRLRKIIYSLCQNVYFDIYIFTMVGINTCILVAQTFAVVEIRGGEWPGLGWTRPLVGKRLPGGEKGQGGKGRSGEESAAPPLLHLSSVSQDEEHTGRWTECACRYGLGNGGIDHRSSWKATT